MTTVTAVSHIEIEWNLLKYARWIAKAPKDYIVMLFKRTVASDTCIPCPMELEIKMSDPSHTNMGLVDQKMGVQTIELIYQERRWLKIFSAFMKT